MAYSISHTICVYLTHSEKNSHEILEFLLSLTFIVTVDVGLKLGVLLFIA